MNLGWRRVIKSPRWTGDPLKHLRVSTADIIFCREALIFARIVVGVSTRRTAPTATRARTAVKSMKSKITGLTATCGVNYTF